MYSDLRTFSDRDSSSVALTIKGFWSDGDLHPNFVISFANALVKKGMNVLCLDRHQDRLLSEQSGAVDIYIAEICETVDCLVRKGKQVHLVGISFGGYLSLRAVSEFGARARSIVAIAPMIDPYSAILPMVQHDAEGISHVIVPERGRIDVRMENIESVKDRIPWEIWLPGAAILGDRDGFEKPENLRLLRGAQFVTHLLPGVRHLETTGHVETRRILGEFYHQFEWA